MDTVEYDSKIRCIIQEGFELLDGIFLAQIQHKLLLHLSLLSRHEYFRWHPP
ncbi:MAG: hypothetical protein Q9228_008141, partial [Teloschistes exilis]